ncbi:MAG: MOSC domain-containing protein [Nitrospina sp.]|nr:MOSC domain-containing protein [Nitrospina sp.]MBT3875788.1 MOSC domain-containing protein [Nitrospina sp.]MBT4049235.1 MOSC domain-containing protein [Nitrospina sp.]MBT4557203.1 MOSC domain-containing protein [Nitrospina sp.]MBT5349389.1 MOSC domain-containing protein [Nitrospina sp.]
MKIISINIASPSLVSLDGGPKKYKSGIFKTPVSGPIFLDHLGLKGDGVGDTKIHGGEDLALCVYCVEHLSYWNEKLNRKLESGSLGENLSVEGMLETDVNIGDIFEVGSAQVQISQPRQPCHKLNKVFNDQSMACSIKKTGFSGYYLRVLKAGLVESGSTLKLIHKDANGFSIENANALLRKGGMNVQNMEDLISLPALSNSWRIMIQKRLDRILQDKG